MFFCHIKFLNRCLLVLGLVDSCKDMGDATLKYLQSFKAKQGITYHYSNHADNFYYTLYSKVLLYPLFESFIIPLIRIFYYTPYSNFLLCPLFESDWDNTPPYLKLFEISKVCYKYFLVHRVFVSHKHVMIVINVCGSPSNWQAYFHLGFVTNKSILWYSLYLT